jgi:hypothetical protein
MTKGEIEFAERTALNLFDKWNDVTGFVDKFTSYYYEMQGCLIDAVHCGIQMAINENIKIEDDNVVKNL